MVILRVFEQVFSDTRSFGAVQKRQLRAVPGFEPGALWACKLALQTQANGYVLSSEVQQSAFWGRTAEFSKNCGGRS